MANIARTSTIVLILVANGFAVFLRLDSKPFVEVPSDERRIERRVTAGREEPAVDVNVA